jgi:hypothetical protein
MEDGDKFGIVGVDNRIIQGFAMTGPQLVNELTYAKAFYEGQKGKIAKGVVKGLEIAINYAELVGKRKKK